MKRKTDGEAADLAKELEGTYLLYISFCHYDVSSFLVPLKEFTATQIRFLHDHSEVYDNGNMLSTEDKGLWDSMKQRLDVFEQQIDTELQERRKKSRSDADAKASLDGNSDCDSESDGAGSSFDNRLLRDKRIGVVVHYIE